MLLLMSDPAVPTYIQPMFSHLPALSRVPFLLHRMSPSGSGAQFGWRYFQREGAPALPQVTNPFGVTIHCVSYIYASYTIYLLNKLCLKLAADLSDTPLVLFIYNGAFIQSIYPS